METATATRRIMARAEAKRISRTETTTVRSGKCRSFLFDRR
jgi:hypothetical protein